MAFPTENNRLVQQLSKLQSTIAQLKRIVIVIQAKIPTDTVNSSDLIDSLYQSLISSRDVIVESGASAAFVQYAKDQLDSPSLDIAVEGTALLVKINSTIAWMQTNYPKSSGFLLKLSFDGGTGELVSRIFSATELATLDTELTDLLLLID